MDIRYWQFGKETEQVILSHELLVFKNFMRNHCQLLKVTQNMISFHTVCTDLCG